MSAVHHSNDRKGKRTSYESFAYELPASPGNKTLWLGKMRIAVDFQCAVVSLFPVEKSFLCGDICIPRLGKSIHVSPYHDK